MLQERKDIYYWPLPLSSLIILKTCFFPLQPHNADAANRPPSQRVLTGDNRRYAPANGVVEPDVAVVDVPQLRQHAVDVQPLHEHPRKGAHVEVVEEDGDDGAHELGREKEKMSLPPKHTSISRRRNSQLLNGHDYNSSWLLFFLFLAVFRDNQFPSDFNLPVLQARLLTSWTGRPAQTAAFG